MMGTREKEKKGCWLKEKILGSGGFGTVSLWKNEETDECLALKECRLLIEMTPKQKQRWQMECDIMMRLDHNHVVQARPIPQVLNNYSGELPLMGMEYCAGGDLRKVINKPENCCGLPQHQILNIVKDISSAIEYLHALKIIHRDLKPDNIVIQRVDEKIVYKLIDLGYAKDLDQGSVAMSFVGTMQYLAPELFHSSRYSSTVDYWSFGITVFECITGYRPFLHSVPPIRWQQIVCKKTSDQIHAFFNEQGGVSFSEKLPYPNHLNGNIQQYFERWLRWLLAWDANDRGGGLSKTSNRPICFEELDKILMAKTINVYCAPTNEVLTYHVGDQDRFKQIQRLIEQETKIPVGDQEILQMTGVPLDSNTLVPQCCNTVGEEEQFVYLFKKNATSHSTDQRKNVAFPPGTRRLMDDPKTLMMYEDQKQAWGHSVFFCKEIADNFRRLKDAQRAYNMYLMRYKSVLSQCKTQMKTEAGDLRSKTDFFHRSLQFDLHKLAAQSRSGLYSSTLHNSWKSMMEEVNRSNQTEKDVGKLDSQCESIDVEVIELQRSPFAKARQIDQLAELEKKAVKLYEDLRHLPSEERTKQNHRSNAAMAKVVSQCLREYKEVSQALYTHLSKIASCKVKVAKLIPDVQQVTKRLREQKDVLLEHQDQRQREVWSLLTFAVKQGVAAASMAQPLSGASDFTRSPSPIPGPPVLDLQTSDGVQGSDDTGVQGSDDTDANVREVFAKSSEMASTLRKECTEQMSMLSEAMSNVSTLNGREDSSPRASGSNTEWDFLEAASKLMSHSSLQKK